MTKNEPIVTSSISRLLSKRPIDAIAMVIEAKITYFVIVLKNRNASFLSFCSAFTLNAVLI